MSSLQRPQQRGPHQEDGGRLDQQVKQGQPGELQHAGSTWMTQQFSPNLCGGSFFSSQNPWAVAPPSVLSLTQPFYKLFFLSLSMTNCSLPPLPPHPPQAETSSGNRSIHHSVADTEGSTHTGKGRPVSTLRGTGSKMAVRRASREQRPGVRVVRLDPSGSNLLVSDQ